MAEPDITLQAVHVSAGSNVPVGRIVIHTTSPGKWSFPETSLPPSAHGTALYFQQQSSGGSAHYVEDTETEEHCVADNAVAWHAPPNGHSIGIEICGHPDYTTEQWLDPQVWPAVVKAAWRTAELCDRFEIPKVKIGPSDLLAGALGICGHVDVSQAWHETDHTDPGSNFPWAQFFAAVNGGQPAPAPPHPEDETVQLIYVVQKGKDGAPSGPVFLSWGREARQVSAFSDEEYVEGLLGNKIIPAGAGSVKVTDAAGQTRDVVLADNLAAFGVRP